MSSGDGDAFGGAGGGVIDYECGLTGEAAIDFPGVDEEGAAERGDFELVVVSEANHVEDSAAGYGAADIVEVVHGEGTLVEFQLGVFAVELEVGELGGVGGDAEAVAVVVSEDDVYGAGESLAEFLGDEG